MQTTPADSATSAGTGPDDQASVRQLVQQCQGGSAEAFGRLVQRYQQRVYNLMFRMVGRRHDAEELAQEAFLRAFQNIHRFNGASQFYTWLYRIASNLAISHRRRGGRVKFTSLTRTDADGDDRQDDRATEPLAERRAEEPDVAAGRSETADRIAAALEQLDPEFRVVVILRDMEDMDYAAIGEILELPTGTVKSRLHRARTQLKVLLKDIAE